MISFENYIETLESLDVIKFKFYLLSNSINYLCIKQASTIPNFSFLLNKLLNGFPV